MAWLFLHNPLLPDQIPASVSRGFDAGPEPNTAPIPEASPVPKPGPGAATFQTV